MRLLILTTGNEFTPSMLYKENYIIKAAQDHGDEVFVFANLYTYIKGKTAIAPTDERVEGFVLKRFKFHSYGSDILTTRIRRIDGLEDEIIKVIPDLIFVNCAQMYNIKNLAKIKKALPNVKIVLDFSTKYLNSAKNWISRNILHNLIYRFWLQKALPYVDRVFYISEESKAFAQEMYGFPNSLLEHNNLPGETIPIETKYQYKKEIFDRIGLNVDNVLFLYSGKIYPDKKVDQLVRAFVRTKNPYFRLVIIGVYTDMNSKDVIEPLIASDKRITFMNFVNGEELTKFVCASDLYIQPGSISQTCQTAVCCGTPLCFNDIPTHREIYNGNGFFVDSEDEIYDAFVTVNNNPAILNEMSEKSYQMAYKELDYHIIYKKILAAVSLN